MTTFAEAFFPRTVAATEDGGSFPRRALAGTLDAASIPGRAYAALWHRYDVPMLQSMAQKEADQSIPVPLRVAENLARDPLALLSAPVGGLAGSGGRALASGVGSALLRRAVPVAADAAANAGLSALAQYGTEGRVDPGSLAANAGLGVGMQGIGSAVAKMVPKGRAAIMDNPNFRKWFGDSKVVDEAGSPLTVYHGTSSDFSEFDPRKTGQTYGSDKKGIFFAEDPNSAHNAAIDSRFSVNGNESIMPVNLRIEKPYSPGMTTQQFDEANKAEIFRKAKKLGADGIRLDDGTWIAISPTQIKSATGNRGTFDPNDPNITHFAGGQSPIAGANALAGRYLRGVANANNGNTPVVTNQKQYDALPIGAAYTDANGAPHVKGGAK